MEELLKGWFGDLTILIIPLFAGVICSFIVEAINQATSDRVKGSTITAVICLVVGVFLTLGFPSVVSGWFDTALIVVMNWAFAVLFYHLGGKKIVEMIVGKAIKVVGKKTDE